MLYGGQEFSLAFGAFITAITDAERNGHISIIFLRLPYYLRSFTLVAPGFKSR